MNQEDHQPLEIVIEGLEFFAFHGLLAAERERGQWFRLDLRLELTACGACVSDNIEETVDYAELAAVVVTAAQAQAYSLLERLAAVLADLILTRFALVAAVSLRLAKVKPPVAQAVAGIAVELTRRRSSESN